jgi:hypothetical protein
MASSAAFAPLCFVIRLELSLRPSRLLNGLPRSRLAAAGSRAYTAARTLSFSYARILVLVVLCCAVARAQGEVHGDHREQPCYHVPLPLMVTGLLTTRFALSLIAIFPS